ncbi:AMP-binding protein [Flavobacterium hungaricum]|uniref:Long-chain fatty acid--CoA ligase n=1 Tax=Flavobacterium hungaricum TaxID=2082725 RepID=A0ABR9TM84_9FLAO|nr:AMP-binding protein [Flavobacterium hungaricum]MBE8726466.1 long-chain fatty acid--CoA ligase [Flavobacterium hungaricum]
MELYDLIQKNKKLNFIDAKTKVVKTFTDLHESLDIEDLRAVVFIYNDNQLPSIEAFLNFYQKKYTVALLNADLHSSFKQNLENEYSPAYIFDPSRTAVEGYDLKKASEDISVFKRKQIRLYPIHGDIKLLMSTSGTTGSPKFVKISDHNLVQNALSIMEYMPITEHDVVPLNVPINFVYGFSIFTTNCIKANTIVCTDRDVLQKEFWSDLAHYGYSTLSGVPYFYELLHRFGFFKKDTPSLRYLTHTGGMLNKELANVISDYTQIYGKQFFAQYGQTEASGRMAVLPPKDFQTKGTSIGFPVKNGRFEIDESTGELIYYGPNVSGGYANNIFDLQDYNHTDKLYTGDLAEKDELGYYHIKGRIKRIIKLFGVRLNLDEVEVLLKNELGGQTFICISVQDKYLGIIHQDESLQRETITQVLKVKLGLHASSLKTYYFEEVPLTVNGKVDYPAVNKYINENENSFAAAKTVVG